MVTGFAFTLGEHRRIVLSSHLNARRSGIRRSRTQTIGVNDSRLAPAGDHFDLNFNQGFNFDHQYLWWFHPVIPDIEC